MRVCGDETKPTHVMDTETKLSWCRPGPDAGAGTLLMMTAAIME